MELFKRALALLLCICMILSLAACGGRSAQSQEALDEARLSSETGMADDAISDENEAANQADLSGEKDLQGVDGASYEMDRQDKELIADLIGGQDASSMSDEELDTLVKNLIESTDSDVVSEVVNLGTEQKVENPSVDVSANPDVYDENGAMTKPFDQVYPELIETEQVSFSGESILIKLASNTLTDGLKAAGVGALDEIVPMSECAWYEAKLIVGADVKSALQAVRELDETLLAEYNYEVQISALDDYKYFDKEKGEEFEKNGHNKDQWHFHHCGIVDGYEEMETSGGDSSVIVAVIDSGVDYNHEDLKDNMWVNADEIPDNNIDDDNNGYVDDYYGVDIVAGVGSGDDTNGHGTHVAGIIAARNNNVGVLGIAYNVKVMSVKAATHNGTLNQADIAKAIYYAYENGAEVINMSFGGSACSIAVQDALATAYTRCVLVASAGNDGENNEPTATDPVAVPNYPAALSYVLGVMSVDETGTESVFTNWDVQAFNGVEYELYAPGENIMSTLPGNQYGYLSGTSMAAPVVSAFAAILRSEYADRDKYPTKFIYGQLASTSGYCAECIDPEGHAANGTTHNLPQIANLYDALTKLPNPEVNLQDYALFDDPKYSSKNNGDGVIDAGETIALGLTLSNRWGMSENTQVTIDTLSDSTGLADPYITIQESTISYGSVGTYSTKDAGKVYTNGMLTGWENPFLITVSEDCPNDYRFTINVTITCENALDEEDTTVYTAQGEVAENVRSGCVLPAVIEEDMVLTSDSLYIIPRATVIQAGTTVRVEPGTHIQFWSDDADDPYAEEGIAYLRVEGNFFVEGTKEDPVYIYPSELMSDYVVDFGEAGNGEIRLQYADITNLNKRNCTDSSYTRGITYAYGCTFRQNYSTTMRYRTMAYGKVTENNAYEVLLEQIDLAEKCVFYRMGNNESAHILSSYGAMLWGTADTCIFVDCGLSVSTPEFKARNCVFLGNALWTEDRSELYDNSSVTIGAQSLDLAKDSTLVTYRAETGTTYIMWVADQQDRDAMHEYLSAAMNGGYAILESQEELDWLIKNKGFNTAVRMGIQKDQQTNALLWSDGTAIGAFLLPDSETAQDGPYEQHITVKGELTSYHESNAALYEIPGQVLPEDIRFAKYEALLDLETTYQIKPLSTPLQLPGDQFLYESSDEAVITVSQTGLVTPVGIGTADVWVSSPDKAVKNRVTFTVREYVPLEGISFPDEAIELAAGKTVPLDCTLMPADTTRRNVTYTSSDPNVAAVDAFGFVTGISSGKATISAAAEGFSDTMEITVYTEATSLDMSSITICAALADGTVDLPEAILSTGAEAELTWRSADTAVAVIEDGKLVLKGLGTTAVIVTDRRSGLSASCLLVVTDTAASGVRAMDMSNSGAKYYYVLLEDGRLFTWDGTYRTTPVCVATDVNTFAAGNSQCAIVLTDGTIKSSYMFASPVFDYVTNALQGMDIIDLAFGSSGEAFYALTANGTAYSWGTINTYGQLGVGTTGTVSTPTLINLDDIVDIAISKDTAWFLTDSGELYAAGYLIDTSSTVPVLIDTNVAKIQYAENGGCAYLSGSGQWKRYSGGETTKITEYAVDLSGLEQVAFGSYAYEGIGIRDGKVYTFMCDSAALTEVPGISNAVDVFSYYGTHYIATADGLLFGLGKNTAGRNSMAGETAEDPVSTPVLISLAPLAEETVTLAEDNLESGVLTNDTLLLTFNKALHVVAPKLYGDGVQVTMNYTVEDYTLLQISRAKGFEEGVNYELVFEAGSISALGGITNTEELRVTFTYAPVAAEDEAADSEIAAETPVVYASILDESIARIPTKESLNAELEAFLDETQYNPDFYGNAILNPTATDTKVDHWLRITAGTMGVYTETPLGGNWWGTVNEDLIDRQILDYTDLPTLDRLMYEPYLTQAPENTFPFVTSVKLLDKYGDEVTTVGNEQITFQVKFNRDMDTTIPLRVCFGSAYPYTDYQVDGVYVDARTWEGTYTLNTLIENGTQYVTISNGCSATDALDLQIDWRRFSFEIDTTAAQALIMQGTATDTGIELKWTQDDFETLMGYNVYRATKEDGLYTRLNKTVIPADTMTFFDDTVEPGVVYYYNFTVVQTDLSESVPSGKIVIMSKDTMAPNIYHSPVASAFTGSNLVLSATITDNLNIVYANLYYRIAGEDTWNTIRMNKLNDKYSAIIPAAYVTLAGIEYYIEAFDGVSFTSKGGAEGYYTVTVQEAIDANALGDVDGDGVITNLDAVLLLYTINDKYNMTEEEFARADLNGDGVLWAAEALRILQYVSGVVGSVKM